VIEEQDMRLMRLMINDSFVFRQDVGYSVNISFT